MVPDAFEAGPGRHQRHGPAVGGHAQTWQLSRHGVGKPVGELAPRRRQVVGQQHQVALGEIGVRRVDHRGGDPFEPDPSTEVAEVVAGSQRGGGQHHRVAAVPQVGEHSRHRQGRPPQSPAPLPRLGLGWIRSPIRRAHAESGPAPAGIGPWSRLDRAESGPPQRPGCAGAGHARGDGREAHVGDVDPLGEILIQIVVDEPELGLSPQHSID